MTTATVNAKFRAALPAGAWKGVRLFRAIAIALALGCSTAGLSWANDSGNSVAVIYNRSMASSKKVAEHYAARRRVPAGHLLGLDLPETESISRGDYRRLLQEPLKEWLQSQGLLILNHPNAGESAPGPGAVWSRSPIRYLVLCYGVPLRIEHDPELQEAGAEEIRPEFRRDEAAVDSELAVLPRLEWPHLLSGPVRNFQYETTNAADLSPARGILMVARLDGPSPAVANQLVDKALAAEANGLWGRAYFDARGLTNGPYLLGDEWIRRSAQITRRLGFETTLDNQPTTFPLGYPMSQIAIYAGWYDGQVSGPFLAPDVEFMPGAIAYHLHSFSAASIRTASAHWVGPLLARGATATMGCVAEPYLEGTPDLPVFFSRLIYFGFSFGEAAYASQPALSWQTTVVGDPLYRPFGLPAQLRHEQLRKNRNPWLQWSYLRVVDLNLATGLAPARLIDYLEPLPELRSSAVLQEKLGDLALGLRRFDRAATAYRRALRLGPSHWQRLRLELDLGKTLAEAGRPKQALAAYEKALKQYPQFPGRQDIYRELAPLADALGAHSSAAEDYLRQVEELCGVSRKS